MKTFALASPLFLTIMLFCSVSAYGQNHGATIPDRAPQYVANQLLVRFKASTSGSAEVNVNRQMQTKVVSSYSIIPGLQLVQLQAGADFQQALSSYRSDPNVLYAEPNYIRQGLDSTPNDIYFSNLWNLHNIGQKISFPYATSDPTNGVPGDDVHAVEAWEITTGSSNVVIGLIDTGVDYEHEDLAANIYHNQADCNSNGVDDEGNGYVDDCYGINALDNNSDPMDQVGHGTHVAGIIGAVGNNGLGIAGINWNVRILTCKFLGFDGGTDDGAIACLNYMAAMKDRGVNIVATNNSWGGYGYSQALYDAIDAQRQRGILFMAAAGNSSSDNDGSSPLYPASYSLPNIISVAATTYTDALAYFSSFGAHTVDIGAPGYRILSTTPDNTYSIFDGTSMATPHVTGVAGLLAAQNPTRDWKTIKNLILTSGDKLTSLTATVTHSRLNALNALTCSNRVLDIPLLPSARSVLASVGAPLTVSELNARCGTPAGNPQISISPGGQAITLLDDGNKPDQDPNDAIYTGQWTATTPGLYTLTYGGGQTVIVDADPYAYTPASFQYRDFAGTNLKLIDNSFGFIEPPFPLSYGGGAYEGIYVSDNGYLTFDSALPQAAKTLPYQYATTEIAPFWDDLVPTANGNVYWTVNGTAPNRELVIEWRNMGHAGCKTDGSESVSFEAVFPENSTDVLFNYKKTAFGGTCTANDHGALASVGIQLSATVAKQYSFQNASLADNTALDWKATLPQNQTPSIAALSPKSWVADVFDFYVDITGSNFGNNSVVLVNGSPRTTYVFSPSEVYGVIRASDLATTGTLQLSIFNGLPGGGPSPAMAFPVNADDFSVNLSASAVSVKAGQSATVTVSVYSNPVFYDGVSLSCTGLPVNASCKFDPARILAGGYSILTITTAPPTSAVRSSAIQHVYTLAVLLLPLAGSVLIRIPRSSLTSKIGFVLLLVALLAMMLSCGGGGPSTQHQAVSSGPSGPTTTTTAVGTYTININGISSMRQHSTVISLTVTQ